MFFVFSYEPVDVSELQFRNNVWKWCLISLQHFFVLLKVLFIIIFYVFYWIFNIFKKNLLDILSITAPEPMQKLCTPLFVCVFFSFFLFLTSGDAEHVGESAASQSLANICLAHWQVHYVDPGCMERTYSAWTTYSTSITWHPSRLLAWSRTTWLRNFHYSVNTCKPGLTDTILIEQTHNQWTGTDRSTFIQCRSSKHWIQGLSQGLLHLLWNPPMQCFQIKI